MSTLPERKDAQFFYPYLKSGERNFTRIFQSETGVAPARIGARRESIRRP